MAGISSKAAGKPDNKYEYNGIEHNDDFDLNMYDAFYRNLDPQIGRFWQIDPKPTDWGSPYAAMGNNPILYNDLLGDTIGISDNSYFDNKKGAYVEQFDITITGKVVNESTTTFTPEQMQEFTDRISQSLISTYSDVSENSTTTVTTNITVETATNSAVSSDHLFIFRDEGNIPDANKPGGFRPMGVIGHSAPGEKGIYMATSILSGVPATSGAFEGTGKTSSGDPTLERTASHEFGHSLFQDGGSKGFTGHPADNSKPGNLMNQTGKPDAGMKLTPQQRQQIRQDYNDGKLNKGRQRY